VHNVPVTDVRDDEESEERSRPRRAREVLSAMPASHAASRDAL